MIKINSAAKVLQWQRTKKNQLEISLREMGFVG